MPSAYSKVNSYFDAEQYSRSPEQDRQKSVNVRRSSQKPKSCSYDITSKFSKPLGPQSTTNAEKDKDAISTRYHTRNNKCSPGEINWTNRIELARSRQSSKKNLCNVTGINDAERRLISNVDTKSILSKNNLEKLNS